MSFVELRGSIVHVVQCTHTSPCHPRAKRRSGRKPEARVNNRALAKSKVGSSRKVARVSIMYIFPDPKVKVDYRVGFFWLACGIILFCQNQVATFKPASHTSPMVGDSLSVVIRGENLQRILHISNHRQWTSPTLAIYENQAL